VFDAAVVLLPVTASCRNGEGHDPWNRPPLTPGAGVLIVAIALCIARGDKLVLRNVSSAALRVIELSGFGRLLSIED
jgi:hypothetical protein